MKRPSSTIGKPVKTKFEVPESSSYSSEDEEEIEEELADVTFGDLQKARSNGSHVLLPQPKPKDDKKKAARANKNRPMEVSSKKPVSRFREVIQAPKKVVRDPRFESLCGTLNVDGFRKRYDFLFSNELPAEKEDLKKQLKTSKDPEVIEDLKKHISWIDKQLKSDSSKHTEAEILAKHKKKEREKAKQGKQPFFIKKSDIRKKRLIEKYKNLEGSGKLDNFLEQRRKKNASKDHRYMPYLMVVSLSCNLVDNFVEYQNKESYYETLMVWILQLGKATSNPAWSSATTSSLSTTTTTTTPPSSSPPPFPKTHSPKSSPSPPLPALPDPLRQQAALDLDRHLAARPASAPRPLCAVIDFQMGWTKELFWKFDLRPDEIRPIPGLPDSMSLTYSDLKRKSAGLPRGGPGGPKGPPSGGGGGLPKPGNRPPWVPEVEGSVELMFNTCDYLERPFIDYMTDQMGIPTWGVGPLLPESYWRPSDSSISHRQIRAQQRQSNYTENDVVGWLDAKPGGSVLYVAFGSEVGSTAEEYPQLASALEETTGPFIWVIQSGAGGSVPGYYPDGLESRVGERGLIIKGWAPQLVIPGHPSTGGFLSHCGWNSTAEALGRGVPFLGWPVRGDQYFNAKLVVNYLKVAEDLSEMVRKEDIVRGIERVMGDEEMKKRFEDGFPASAKAALDAFGDFITSQEQLRSYIHD
ncbi:hypothetical protein ACLB2K_077170 [Fragaria x ananassa]